MSFWQRIFGTKENNDSSNNSDSHFNEYRKELKILGYESEQDLEKLVKPLIRPATRIILKSVNTSSENSQETSHFGGQPYFEIGEKWPTTKSGKSLDFIFQIFNNSDLEIPNDIELIQFYYEWDEFPWDTENDGWLVKIYKNLNPKTKQIINKPKELEDSKFCLVEFDQTKSLPDWEGIETYSEVASKLSCVLDEDEPWENYGQIVTKLIGENEYQSQLGGYPNWVQGESTPKDSNGKPMSLLFQIDSEDKAELMWGDVGLIYVFYDPTKEKIEFTLQCH